MAATPQSATMQFGLVDVGSGYPPPAGHDSSGHANDTIVPQTVVIDQGGTVTINAVDIHEVAIYKAGFGLADVNTTSNLVPHPCGLFLPPLIGPDANQLAYFATGCGPRTYTQTFVDPGEYLVICSVLPHFQTKMYGWVRVRER
jgi:plastocyanin